MFKIPTGGDSTAYLYSMRELTSNPSSARLGSDGYARVHCLAISRLGAPAGSRLVSPGVERNRNDRDAPGCPHGPVSAGYAATSSPSASRSQRAPLQLPQS